MKEMYWYARNRGVAHHPLVQQHARQCGVEIRVDRPGNLQPRIGWGYKASGLWAKECSHFRLFEDGFIRSLRPGYTRGAIYGIVEDQDGIYYDAKGQSTLVEGLNGRGPIGHQLSTESWQAETNRNLQRYLEIGASKYNWFEYEHRGPAIDEAMPQPGALVVDQTRGDAALTFGKANPDSFRDMLTMALDENEVVYVRTHPDALFRSRQSCFPQSLLNDGRVKIVSSQFAPHQIFPRAEKVYVFNSLLGMESLLHGCTAKVFGYPFYAGWGLTEEVHPQPSRERERTIHEIFHAAYQLYTLYFDPNTGERCDLGRILDHLERQKKRHSEMNHRKIHFGFPGWKSRLIAGFLTCPGTQCISTRSKTRALHQVEKYSDSKCYVWSRLDPPTPIQNPVRVEDGFLRSSGLGADFHTPVSLVFDTSGIYFDSESPSDLERLLEKGEFTDPELEEAAELLQFLVKHRVTKYNLTGESDSVQWPRRGKTRILVPGQVENDASLLYGNVPVKTNLDFLKRVRERHPDASIAFKPHPDLVSKLRPGQPLGEAIESQCDLIVPSLDIVPWIEACDEVHTLTSLAGFEALMRGKKVICHGAPFYAGWGLTSDCTPTPRRTRQLTIKELVAGALVRYPTYLNPRTGEFISALEAARILASTSESDFSRPAIFRLAAAAKRALHFLR